jgi:mono/diheme cytochrome c family protein
MLLSPPLACPAGGGERWAVLCLIHCPKVEHEDMGMMANCRAPGDSRPGTGIEEALAEEAHMTAARMSFRLVPLALAAGLAAPGAQAQAVEKPSFDAADALMGASTFKTYCASCHGKGARGDGPVADQLRFNPPDLTRIARRNRGKFDFDKVFRMIDGRNPVKGHGGTDMPIWGDAFLESREGYDAQKVKEKISQVVHYLASIQD